MRGEVIKIDNVSGDGLISGDDGLRYTFSAAAIRGSARVGDKVDFVVADGVATEIMSLGGARENDYLSGPRATDYDFGSALFAFEGRLRRSHFWISWAILFGASLVLGWIPIIGTLLSIVAIWPNVAIQVKRLHDMGRTGWWVTAPLAANIVGLVVIFVVLGMSYAVNPTMFEQDDPAAAFAVLGPMFAVGGVLVIINIGFLLWIGIVDTQPGRNKYGRNPKYMAGDAASAFS